MKRCFTHKQYNQPTNHLIIKYKQRTIHQPKNQTDKEPNRQRTIKQKNHPNKEPFIWLIWLKNHSSKELSIHPKNHPTKKKLKSSNQRIIWKFTVRVNIVENMFYPTKDLIFFITSPMTCSLSIISLSTSSSVLVRGLDIS